jgi:transcriptional regulator with XRE-family HTH domain
MRLKTLPAPGTVADREPLASTLEALARNVIIYRARRRLSQQALADRAGVSRATISNIERGEGDPGITIVTKLAVALDTSPAELLVDGLPPESATDEELAQLAESARDDAVDAHALIAAIDEAVDRPVERYSRAGRPRGVES